MLATYEFVLKNRRSDTPPKKIYGLNPIQDGHFRDCSWIGGGGGKKLPPP